MLSQPSTKTRNALCAFALLGVLGTVAVLQFDQLLSSNMRAIRVPGDIKKAINLAEVFGHGFGVAAILGAVFVVAVDRRRAIWGAMAITALAGITANFSKQAIVRIRPNSQGAIQVGAVLPFEEPGNAGFPLKEPRNTVLPFEEPRNTVLQLEEPRNTDTSDGVEIVAASFWDSRQRSFPSGHSATAWGLAIGLSLVFPRGAWLFAFFAILACLQRVVSGAHFPSDVFAGSAIAFLVAAVALSFPRVRGLFLDSQFG